MKLLPDKETLKTMWLVSTSTAIETRDKPYELFARQLYHYLAGTYDHITLGKDKQVSENPKLFPVTLSLTVMVAADDADGAEAAAREQMREICETEFSSSWSFLSGDRVESVGELTSLGFREWRDALPWGRNNEELSCWQILERQ